jgi:hypothetical protein
MDRLLSDALLSKITIQRKEKTRETLTLKLKTLKNRMETHRLFKTLQTRKREFQLPR